MFNLHAMIVVHIVHTYIATEAYFDSVNSTPLQSPPRSLIRPSLQHSAQLETEAFRFLNEETQSLFNFRDRIETEKHRSLNIW